MKKGLKENFILNSTKRIKYEKSTLSNVEQHKIHEQLKYLMLDRKIFLNPDLTLKDLAAQIYTTPNNLSQVINSIENKNYYDFLNGFRIEYFKKQIFSLKHVQQTLVSIAFDCGFNSKSTFNRCFKRFLGLTPSEFVKQQLNKP